jgi:hypothetical protein
MKRKITRGAILTMFSQNAFRFAEFPSTAIEGEQKHKPNHCL